MSAATRLRAAPAISNMFAYHRTCFCVLLALLVLDAIGGSHSAVMDNAGSQYPSSASTSVARNRGYLDAETEGCQPDKLTVYKVILHTFWSRDKFPKHYPDWRPSSQWSKVFAMDTIYRWK
ncbi:hypothetical protein AMK59_4414, partial [Oryctes borbonicus]